MIADEFRNFVRNKPFRRYRVTLTDGRAFEIKHPEGAIVGFGAIVVGRVRKNADNVLEDDTCLISLLHVMQIEFLEPADVPSSDEQNEA
ncbi:MAG: hypothetical protein HYR84_11550 [Planctomycetes bacterium]|nr:hypothetical protein [Planctomycetota bacterium]